VSEACEICKKGTLIKTVTGINVLIQCSHCGRGWSWSLASKHVSPCHDSRFKPPIPRILNRTEDSEHEDYYPDNEKSETEEPLNIDNLL
jgi:hypothetical protein